MSADMISDIWGRFNQTLNKPTNNLGYAYHEVGAKPI